MHVSIWHVLCKILLCLTCAFYLFDVCTMLYSVQIMFVVAWHCWLIHTHENQISLISVLISYHVISYLPWVPQQALIMVCLLKRCCIGHHNKLWWWYVYWSVITMGTTTSSDHGMFIGALLQWAPHTVYNKHIRTWPENEFI